MNIVLFCHPSFFSSQSMPRFAQTLAKGMEARGHKVEIWQPKPIFFRLPSPNRLKKWLGYIDQYIVFPAEVQRRLKNYPPNTLFVFADQALGTWVPLVADRAHVIHCHDFLAQQSALGELTRHSTTWTGKQYQALIRRGFSKGKHFISVSQNTRSHLERLLTNNPEISKVIYNQVSPVFKPCNTELARKRFSSYIQNICSDSISINKGYLLHVGIDIWYKNRRGVLEIYEAWSRITKDLLPLIIIGDRANTILPRELENGIGRKKVIFLERVPDTDLAHAYAGASALLFPSLEEGFGWPIAEAMASGCPVITTNKAPMTEVGGDAAFYIPQRPERQDDVKAWAEKAALKINEILIMNAMQREVVIEASLRNVQRFDQKHILNQIEETYEQIIVKYDVTHRRASVRILN